jgi:hypothetical protein
MSLHSVYPLPKLHHLLAALPLEGAVRLDLHEGLPVLRASTAVQERIADLLHKQQRAALTPDELEELDRYEEMDDYFSFLNRIVRNLSQTSQA